jgi:hypothetical protein
MTAIRHERALSSTRRAQVVQLCASDVARRRRPSNQAARGAAPRCPLLYRCRDGGKRLVWAPGLDAGMVAASCDSVGAAIWGYLVSRSPALRTAEEPGFLFRPLSYRDREAAVMMRWRIGDRSAADEAAGQARGTALQ